MTDSEVPQRGTAEWWKWVDQYTSQIMVQLADKLESHTDNPDLIKQCQEIRSKYE